MLDIDLAKLSLLLFFNIQSTVTSYYYFKYHLIVHDFLFILSAKRFHNAIVPSFDPVANTPILLSEHPKCTASVDTLSPIKSVQYTASLWCLQRNYEIR